MLKKEFIKMVLKRAKPNKKNRNADQYNFRVGTAQKKADFQSRTNRLKEEKNISAREIYEAGLKVFEEGDSEAQILYRRNKTISERDTLFNMFFEGFSYGIFELRDIAF